MNYYRTSQRGFTLLLASLVASLLMALGLSLFRIAQKEVQLSSLGRDSQFAFYAADTGAECALYWDFFGAFDSTTVPTTNATCAATNLGSIGGVPLGTPSTFQFEPNGYCVNVSVTKNDSAPFTQIESRGYSTSCAQETSPRRLERAVRIQL